MKELYRHFKGNVYEKIGTCKDSETTAEMVIYKGADQSVWVRPATEFHGKVDGNIDRFRRVMRRDTAIKLVKAELTLVGCVDDPESFKEKLSEFLVAALEPDFLGDVEVDLEVFE